MIQAEKKVRNESLVDEKFELIFITVTREKCRFYIIFLVVFCLFHVNECSFWVSGKPGNVRKFKIYIKCF